MIKYYFLKKFLHFKGCDPKCYRILRSDFSGFKATVELIAQYRFDNGHEYYRYIFELINIPNNEDIDSAPCKFERVILTNSEISRLFTTMVPGKWVTNI